MLTVWAVWWGKKYPEHYVRRMASMVRRNVMEPYQFKVLTNKPLEGIETVNPQCDYEGWWQKLALFKPGIAGERNLYIDLDSVIVAILDPMLIRYREADLAMPRNWAQSGHDSCQSSVMAWRGGAYPQIWDRFDYQRDHGRLWGDQEWMTELLGKPGEGAVTAIESGVVSYKYHCRGKGLPAAARVVTFHGEPKPAEAEDAWIRRHWW